MQKQDYTSQHIKKVMIFKEREVLNINIKCPEFNNKKKLNKFYYKIAEAFSNFCGKKLYRKAAEKFLTSGDGEFKIFFAELNFSVKSEQKLIKVYLDININGEYKRMINIWDINTGELMKPLKTIARKKSPRKKVKKFFDS